MGNWNITVPNLIGYTLVLWIFIVSLAHWSAARECRRKLFKAEREFSSRTGELLRAPRMLFIHEREGLQVALDKVGHPSAFVLGKILREPKAAMDQSAVDGWTGTAIQEQIGSLRTGMERIRSLAPAVGFIGTVAGFLMASWIFSKTQDQSQLMSSLALALVTTLGGAIVALIEQWILQSILYPLESHLIDHALTTTGQGRVLIAPVSGKSGIQSDRVACIEPERAADITPTESRWKIDDKGGVSCVT
jgi:biopolymer transport protein ExbB/TolQ